MREKSFGSDPKSKHETCAPSENPSEPSLPAVKAIENCVKVTIAADDPIRKLAMDRTLTAEEQMSFTELQARIKMYNRAIPRRCRSFAGISMLQVKATGNKPR